MVLPYYLSTNVFFETCSLKISGESLLSISISIIISNYNLWISTVHFIFTSINNLIEHYDKINIFHDMLSGSDN